ncbi:MAG: hypothetical protein NVS2B3_11550 [Vulcanimicrobiaceae bacterium]
MTFSYHGGDHRHIWISVRNYWEPKIVNKKWTLRRRDFETSCSYRREFLRFLCDDVGRDVVSDGSHELVFGELVTNAVRYGEEPMRVYVSTDHDSVVIVVENAGSCADCKARTAHASAEGGRGLHIVRALVSRLEIERDADVPCRVTATMPLRRASA